MEYISLGSNCSVTYQLNKFHLRTQAYPFDWCKISLQQLIDVLSNNFINFAESIEFKKISFLHSIMYETIETKTQSQSQSHTDYSNNSLLLTNKYGINFAHELESMEKIEEFKNNLEKRIQRFYNLSIKSNKIKFIRIELNQIKTNWSNQIFQLISLLNSIGFSYELILIINSSTNFMFGSNVKIYKFKNFSSDWKMNELNWNDIFLL